MGNSNGASSSSSAPRYYINLNEPPLGFETNEASPSSSLCRNNVDLNKPPVTNETNPTSSRHHHIDLNKAPAELDTEEPQNPSSRGSQDITQNSPNPNPQSCSSRNNKRKSSGEAKKAKKKKQEAVLEAPPPTPNWLLNLEEAEDVKFIFKKSLSASDLKKHQSRLLIPFNKVHGNNDFLTPEEKRLIEQDKDKGRKHQVKTTILMIGNTKKWDLRLVLWLMKKKESAKKPCLNYALIGGWNKFAAEQVDPLGEKMLVVNKVISLWSFRSQGTLCFALDVQPPSITQINP